MTSFIFSKKEQEFNKRSVPIKRTVSCNWNQRVPIRYFLLSRHNFFICNQNFEKLVAKSNCEGKIYSKTCSKLKVNHVFHTFLWLAIFSLELPQKTVKLQNDKLYVWKMIWIFWGPWLTGAQFFFLCLKSTGNWMYLIMNRLNDKKGLIQRKKEHSFMPKFATSIQLTLLWQQKQYFRRHLRVQLWTSEIFVLKAIRIACIT